MHRYDGEEAFETLSEGIGRRDLLKGAAVVGAGAVAPAWMLSKGATDALAGPNRTDRDLEIPYDEAPGGAGPRVLQPGRGRIQGRYIPSTPGTVRWGFLPNRDSRAVASVRSGAVVTFDRVSHDVRVDVLGLVPRVPYGVISNRHGKGALPGEYPVDRSPIPKRARSAPSCTRTSRSSPRCASSGARTRAFCRQAGAPG